MSDAGQSRLIFALDVPVLAQAEDWLQRLASQVGLFKVGLELFSSAGPEAVRAVMRHGGAGVFLDLKLHDIPTTVERAARAIGALGVRMLTVHAAGGPAMMEAAARGARAADEEVCVLAVTRLTSQAASCEEVVELSRAAETAGCGGVVCAGSEVSAVRRAVSADFRIVCPGVRPAGAAKGDQVRVVTPEQAFRAGADYVVVGRPIRDASDPVAAARAISTEIARALQSS
jgi:orotidine-5'-phosphate decarboxylase